MTDSLHQTGLTEAEAARRLREHGPNELQRPESRSLWGLLKETLSEPMFQLLLGAGFIYVALGDLGEAAMLLAFVFITVGILLLLFEQIMQHQRHISVELADTPQRDALRAAEEADLSGKSGAKSIDEAIRAYVEKHGGKLDKR